jgi:hypothetical protein
MGRAEAGGRVLLEARGGWGWVRVKVGEGKAGAGEVEEVEKGAVVEVGMVVEAMVKVVPCGCTPAEGSTSPNICEHWPNCKQGELMPYLQGRWFGEELRCWQGRWPASRAV